jgi:lipopolysaccharide/colanic/teichoic acid biosynthesis glycosyltransferase
MKEEKETTGRIDQFEEFSKKMDRLTRFTVFRNDFKLLSGQLGERGFEFVSQYFDKSNSKHILLSSGDIKAINHLTGKNYHLLLTTYPINNIISINEYFAAINDKLERHGLLIMRFTPQKRILRAILKRYPKGINRLAVLWHFFYRRVLPKLTLSRRLYFYITKGKKRSIRKLEMLGRLIACGYEPIDQFETGKDLFLVAQKRSRPFYSRFSSYGLLFKMRRIGKGGKEILVYKLRTMVPFSEYMQSRFIKKNKLAKGGKIKNDCRVTLWGSWLRKCWIDEIPNFINLIKGEMKFVGVRPISRQYFNLYDEELKQLRKKVKPGIIPPFYADLPETLNEIQESEKRYIQAYLKKPITTDFLYFFKALRNIVVKKVRSK